MFWQQEREEKNEDAQQQVTYCSARTNQRLPANKGALLARLSRSRPDRKAISQLLGPLSSLARSLA